MRPWIACALAALVPLVPLVQLAPLAPLANDAAPEAIGSDRYFVVPLSQLEIEGLAPGHFQTNLDQRGSPLRDAYVVLDGAGEAYLDWPWTRSTAWNHEPRNPRAIAARVPEGAPISGRLFLARRDFSGFDVHRFRLDPETSRPHSPAAFRDVARRHFQRLANAELPGTAWFRHRAATYVERDPSPLTVGPGSGIGIGFGSGSGGRSGVGSGRSPEILDLFTGARALAENLDLEVALAETPEDQETIELSSLPTIQTPAMDWAALVQGMEPELDPLARAIPLDQYAVFAPSPAALLDTARFLEGGILDVAARLDAALEDPRLVERYGTQLCFRLADLSRARDCGAVAVTSSDPFFASGTDVAVLFEPESWRVLGPSLDEARAAARSLGAEDVDTSVAGFAVRGVRTADRHVSSFVVDLGGIVAVSNSLAQVEKLAAVARGRAPALAGADEYRWFRDRYRRGDERETALLVLSDTAIRSIVGPRARIGESRRVRAAAALAELEARTLVDRVSGALAVGSAVVDADMAPLGDCFVTPDGVASSRWGTRRFLTPIAELDVELVNRWEAWAYAEFAGRYGSRWRNVFDPIAIRLGLGVARVEVDMTVVPLTIGTEYDLFDRSTDGSALSAPIGAGQAAPLFHFAFACTPGAPDAELLGSEVQVILERDAYWTDLLEASDRRSFLWQYIQSIPIALVCTSQAAPGLWNYLRELGSEVEDLEHEFGGQLAGAPVRFRIVELHGYTLFWTHVGDRWLVSPREDVLQRAVERLISSQAVGPTATAPDVWLGKSAGIRLQSEQAVEVLEAVFEQWRHPDRTPVSWNALPILNEWRRLFPEQDPVAIHERVTGMRLVPPGGGFYVWNEAWQTMESTRDGSPATPRRAEPVPWPFASLAAGLTFEHGGVRVRLELEPEPVPEPGSRPRPRPGHR